MHLNFYPLLLAATFDLILASPTLQNNDELGSDLNVFSSEGSDPLNVGSIDLAFNTDLGDGGGNEVNSNINDFHLDPNDNLNDGSITISTLDLGGSLTGGEISSDDFDSFDNSLNDISLETASCGTENGGGVLRARKDGQSCKNEGTRAPINLPLEVFKDAESAIRRFFEKKPNTQPEPSTQVLPPSASSDGSKKCPPEYPTRCCTDQLGAYDSIAGFRALYLISPPTCVITPDSVPCPTVWDACCDPKYSFVLTNPQYLCYLNWPSS